VVDPAPALARVAAVLTGLGGIQVYTGVPESLAAGVNVWVTLGQWRTTHESGGLVRHDINVDTVFAYRVAGSEATVEPAVATNVGAFQTAYLPKLRNQLDGTVSSTDKPDFSRNGEPEYQTFAGQEHRLYRGSVPITLRETF